MSLTLQDVYDEMMEEERSGEGGDYVGALRPPSIPTTTTNQINSVVVECIQSSGDYVEGLRPPSIPTTTTNQINSVVLECAKPSSIYGDVPQRLVEEISNPTTSNPSASDPTTSVGKMKKKPRKEKKEKSRRRRDDEPTTLGALPQSVVNEHILSTLTELQIQVKYLIQLAEKKR